MKVIICGSSGIKLCVEAVQDIVDLSGFNIDTLICGMAVGVDKSAFQWAIENSIPVIQKPFKRSMGKLGGFSRNQEMVDIADAWIGVIDEDWTPGTKDCYDRARKAGIPIYLVDLSGVLLC